MPGLTRKVAIITGAGSGIGKAIGTNPQRKGGPWLAECRTVSGLDAVFSEPSGHQPLACIRSSIISRSTSQYFSADRRSLSIPSAPADPLSADISGRHCAECLLDFCRLCFDLDIRQPLCRRAAPINILPHKSSSFGVRIAVLEWLCRIIWRLALAFCPD
jgi:hypothetical protein